MSAYKRLLGFTASNGADKSSEWSAAGATVSCLRLDAFFFFFFSHERAAGKLESEGNVELFPLGLMDVEPENDLRPCVPL